MFELVKVLVPVMVGVVAIIVPSITLYQNNKLNKENKELKIKVKDNSIFIQFLFKQSDKIESIMQDILLNTKATRMHLFSSSNGKEDLKYANSLVAYEIVDGVIVKSKETYKALEYDKQYSNFLKRVENEKRVVLNVPVMECSMLKTIYKGIRIRHSIVHFCLRCEIDEDNDRIFYPSIATNSVDPFTEEEEFYIKKKNDELVFCLKEILNINK
jgi:hypothetical protein